MSEYSQRKKKTERSFEVTGFGWCVYIIGLVLLFIEFGVYNGAATFYTKFLYKRHCYEKEYETRIDRDCQILEVTKDFSDINNYKDPVYFVTFKEIETGKEFKEVFLQSPGKKGEIQKLGVKKGIFFGENVKKPELNTDKKGMYTGLLIGTPIISLVLVFLGCGITLEIYKDEHYNKEPVLIRRGINKEPDLNLGHRIWDILYFTPVIAMACTSLIIWILV